MAGFPFHRVVAVSGSGQQHGSVYWREGAEQTLHQLDHTSDLVTQLQVKQLNCNMYINTCSIAVVIYHNPVSCNYCRLT